MRLGECQRSLPIIVGPTDRADAAAGLEQLELLRQTPSSDAKVRAAADAMVSSGLIQHGWTYINIDDCWEAGRDAQGRIQSNEKFPDMKALSDYIHAKGLKFGIYSSPGPKTCAGYEASWQHEDLDARRYAEWGVDYVKYDWCSYGNVAPHARPCSMPRRPAATRRSGPAAGRKVAPGAQPQPHRRPERPPQSAPQANWATC